MQKETINGIANAYIKGHLSPKPEERDMVSREYDTLRGFIGGVCIQSGSWARFTSTTPVNDLDVIWEIPASFLDSDVIRKMRSDLDPGNFDPSSLLAKLAETLEASYKRAGRTVRIVPQSHSVGIYFGESDDDFSIDLVPAIASGRQNEYGDEIYWVPEIARLSKSARIQKYASHGPIDWLLSDPRGYIEDARELNDANESFRKVAKFARKWRRGCKAKNGGKFPLKAFHLELVVNELFKQSLGMNTIEGIDAFFVGLPERLEAPRFPDRANPDRYVDGYVANLTTADKDGLKKSILAAQSALKEMFADNATEQGARESMEKLLAGAAPVAAAAYVPATSFHPQRSYGCPESFGS